VKAGGKKKLVLNGLHGVVSRKMGLFIDNHYSEDFFFAGLGHRIQ
jgi:hypothetical protein